VGGVSERLRLGRRRPPLKAIMPPPLLLSAQMQLREFQRGRLWDGTHTIAVITSVARSIPTRATKMIERLREHLVELICAAVTCGVTATLCMPPRETCMPLRVA
jgi:hypothetical protein